MKSRFRQQAQNAKTINYPSLRDFLPVWCALEWQVHVAILDILKYGMFVAGS